MKLYKSDKTQITDKPGLLKKPRIFYGWYIIAVSWFVSFIATGTSVGIFFKPILDEFGWDRATLSLVSAVVIIIFAVLTPLIGRLIDRIGPKIILFLTVISQALSNVFNAVAGGLLFISIGRFFLEMKPAHPTQVLANRWFIKQRGKALGILSTGLPMGTLALSPVSQYLINTWGWRETMFFWTGILLVIVLPLLFLVKNKPEDAGLFTDGDRAGVAVAAQIPQTLNIKNTAVERGSGFNDIIKYRSFWFLSATQFFCGISCGLFGAHIVIFATDLGYPALIGATFLSVQGALSLVGVFVTGPLSDKIARKNVLSVTHFIRSISFIILVTAIIFFNGSLPMLYAAMVFFGFGWFTTAPLSAGLVADMFGFVRLGTIIGVILASHSIGMALGAYAGGLSFQLTGSYAAIFIVCAVLEIIAAVLAFMITKPSPK